MLTAVLFDLDNTLALYDEPEFYGRYFEKIVPGFSDIMPKDEFLDRLIISTVSLRKNNGEKTNRECFMDFFTEGYKGTREDLWQRFMKFYKTDYDTIEVAVRVPDRLDTVINRLLHSGLKLVIASNPIFPEVVQRKRMMWAGLDKVPFDFVTHMDNMSFVKPREEYYQQVCEMIGESPETCLMVGNDRVNDMVAAKVGLKTFLTNEAEEIDYASLSRNMEQSKEQVADIPEPDFTGPLAEVISAVDTLI